jgi:hypothetical protein
MRQPTLDEMVHRNVLDEMEPEQVHVLDGDTFWISLPGGFGKGKCMGDLIKPGVYRQHHGGIWTGLDKASRIAAQTLSYFWIARNHQSTGNVEIENNMEGKNHNTGRRSVHILEETSVPTLTHEVSVLANEPTDSGQTLGWINRLFKRNN